MDVVPATWILLLCCAALGLAALLLGRRAASWRRQAAKLECRLSGSGRQLDGFGLLEHFPEALLVVSHGGQVLFRTAAWKQLPGGFGSVSSLQELDALLRTRFTAEPRPFRAEVVLRETKGTELERHPYLAVGWPINAPEAALGRAIALYPQGLSKERQREYPMLERQLLECLVSAGRDIAKLATNRTPDHLERIAGQGQALQELGQNIGDMHRRLRRIVKTGHADLGSACSAGLSDIRPELRRNGTRTFNSVGSCPVIGNPDDLRLLVDLLLRLALDRLPGGSELRISKIVTGNNIRLMFAGPFETPLPSSRTALETTLVRQLALKLGGRLERHNDEYCVILRSA
jgi:signal transduction histidine kinase